MNCLHILFIIHNYEQLPSPVMQKNYVRGSSNFTVFGKKMVMILLVDAVRFVVFSCFF